MQDPSQISSSEAAEAEPARPCPQQVSMRRRAAPPRTRQPLLWIACCVASATALVAPTPRAGARNIAPRARRRIAASVVGDDLPSRPVIDGKSYGAELANAYKRCGEITKIFSKTFYFGTTFFSQEKLYLF